MCSSFAAIDFDAAHMISPGLSNGAAGHLSPLWDFDGWIATSLENTNLCNR